MLHAIQYSIIKRLDDDVPELKKVVWITGENTFTEADLPFATVEHIYSAVRNMDKLYGYEATDYYFQIGLRTNSASELAVLQEKVKRALIREEIPMYDTSQSFPPPQTGKLRTEITMINNIMPEEINDTTGKHRCYLDCTVFFISQL
jgi:hypothetical protein